MPKLFQKLRPKVTMNQIKNENYTQMTRAGQHVSKMHPRMCTHDVLQ